MKKEVYCDHLFVDRITKDPPLYSAFNEESLQKHQCWANFCLLLLNSHLHFNMSPNEFFIKTTSNPFYKELQKRRSNGSCKVDFDINSFEDLASSLPDLNALYLVSINKNKAEELSQKNGVLIIPASDYSSYSFIFKDTGKTISIKDPNIKSWDFLKCNKKNICNSMIIVDNFLLNDKNTMKENLKSLFISLLPDCLDEGISFQLAFYAILKDGQKVDIDIKRIYDDILGLLNEVKKEERKKLNVSLTIYKCKLNRFGDPKRFHGRVIITNDYIINCDGGLDLFKCGKSQKLAVINIVYPNITKEIEWAGNAYEDYLKEAKEETNESEPYDKDKHFLPGRYIGDKKMRLWDLLE